MANGVKGGAMSRSRSHRTPGPQRRYQRIAPNVEVGRTFRTHHGTFMLVGCADGSTMLLRGYGPQFDLCFRPVGGRKQKALLRSLGGIGSHTYDCGWLLLRP
jgi:hypothetical protein